MIAILAAALIGYLLGSIPFGLLLTRLAGLGDIRHIGSGSIGATNVLRTGRKGLAAATLVGDALKGTFGVREDHETRELIGLNTGFLIPSIPSFTGGALGGSTTSNLPSGKIELDYKPVADTLIYWSISRGVKSGGVGWRPASVRSP